MQGSNVLVMGHSDSVFEHNVITGSPGGGMLFREHSRCTVSLSLPPTHPQTQTLSLFHTHTHTHTHTFSLSASLSALCSQ